MFGINQYSRQLKHERRKEKKPDAYWKADPDMTILFVTSYVISTSAFQDG
jgi:hypothetical protein